MELHYQGAVVHDNDIQRQEELECEKNRYALAFLVKGLMKLYYENTHCRFLDREVMSHPVVTLQEIEKVSTVVEVLKNERHDGFPVVQNVDSTVSNWQV
jgi:predicted transcriptional regulator